MIRSAAKPAPLKQIPNSQNAPFDHNMQKLYHASGPPETPIYSFRTLECPEGPKRLQRPDSSVDANPSCPMRAWQATHAGSAAAAKSQPENPEARKKKQAFRVD